MEFLAKCTLAEATRQYQSDAKYLKSRKVIIRLCAELLELEPHGQQASIHRRSKRNAEDEYLGTQRFSSLLKSRMKQLRGPAHKTQNLQKQQAIERAEAQQAAKQAMEKANKQALEKTNKRALEKANKRAATKPLRNSKQARTSAAVCQTIGTTQT